MFRIKTIAGLSVLAAAIVAMPVRDANAATATTSFNVTLTITAGCIVSASTLAFGTASLLTTAVSASSTVTPTCTSTTPYTVALDQGGGVGATVAVRRMTGPSATTVTYALYQDAAFSTLWGKTVGTDTQAGVGNGVGQPLTVYGRIPAQSAPIPGAYADVVNVTVNY